jgi:ribosomal protein S18 acetylase RimI-like enzyme
VGVAYEILHLTSESAHHLNRVAAGVFDEPVDASLAMAFLQDPRHHLMVAVDDGVVVGFVSAVNYINPDKPPELWINEVGVASTHHRLGIGHVLMQRMLDHGRQLGCAQAWVLTDADNAAARALYRSVGGQEAKQPALLIEFPFSGNR